MRKLFAVLVLCALGMASNGAAQARANGPKAKRVVLITIDGFRIEMLRDKDMPSPVLKEMAAEGVLAERVVSVAPAITYPNHTALVTGARAARHGIFYNSPFEWGNSTGVANWYADSIKSPTIWEVAKKNGLTTCSLFWPVTVGASYIDYNIPEVWSKEKGVTLRDVLCSHSTPRGIMEELEDEVVGRFSDETYLPGGRNSEAHTAFIASYLLRTYRPALTTIHLWSTDASQHATGTESAETKKSLGAVDYAIGQVVEGLDRAGMLDSTVIVVSGDHGFTDVDRSIAPNIWMQEAGLLSADGTEWKARFHCAGSTAFLYVREAGDEKTVEKVVKKLNSLPQEKRDLFRIVEKDELERLGCSPDAALALEPIVGVGVTGAMKGEDIVLKKAGKHGYLSPRETTVTLFWGNAVRSGKVIPEMSITDVAPVIMELLGLEFDAPDGTLRDGIIR